MPNFAKGMQSIQKRQQMEKSNQLAGELFKNIDVIESDSYGIQMIDYDQLYISPFNTYSIDKDVIDELAEQINDIGLKQPLNVVYNESQKKYEILGGQRRFIAIGILRADHPALYSKVPCKVDDLSKVPENIKNLSDDIKKVYITASTNNNRVMTDADYRLMVSQLNQVYDAMQQAGQIIGEKRRSFISRQAGIGERTVQKILSAEKNMEPQLKEQLAEKEPNISINVAEQLSKLPEEQQIDIAERMEEGEDVSFENELSIQVEDAEINTGSEKEDEVFEKPKSSPQVIPMSQDEVASLLRVGEMSDLMVSIPKQFSLTEKDRKKVSEIGEKIEKLQGQIRKIMKKAVFDE